LVVTVLLNDQAGGFTVTDIPTAYVGKGIAPLLQDVVPESGDGKVDAILVWYVDQTAGQSPVNPQFETFLALLGGYGTGIFSEHAPNHYLEGGTRGEPETTEAHGGRGKRRPAYQSPATHRLPERALPLLPAFLVHAHLSCLALPC
jgi:hypothetical protein